MSMHHIWRLEHFLAIAEAGSYHSAAKSLTISQPALTKSVLQLEAEFGTALFLRLPRDVRLTDAGEMLYRHAREIEASWNAPLIDLEASSGGFPADRPQNDERAQFSRVHARPSGGCVQRNAQGDSVAGIPLEHNDRDHLSSVGRNFSANRGPGTKPESLDKRP